MAKLGFTSDAEYDVLEKEGKVKDFVFGDKDSYVKEEVPAAVESRPGFTSDEEYLQMELGSIWGDGKFNPGKYTGVGAEPQSSMFTEEERAAIEAKGKITWAEAFGDDNLWDKFPFSPTELFRMLKLNAAKTMYLNDNYGSHDPDKVRQLLSDYLKAEEEKKIRGHTFWGSVYDGVTMMPGFMIEVGMTMGATGVLKAGAKKTAKELLEKGVKKGVGKTLLKGVGQVGLAARGGMIGGTITYNRYMPKYMERQIFANIAMNDKGLHIYEESKEKPFTSLLKAMSASWLNYGTELGGSLILKPLFNRMKPIMPKVFLQMTKRLRTAFPKIASKYDLLTKVGYDGFVEEILEEDMARILGPMLGITELGEDRPVFQQIWESMTDWEQRRVEATIFAFPGATNLVAQRVNRHLKLRGLEKDQIARMLDNLSQTEKEGLLAELGVQESEAIAEAMFKIQKGEKVSALARQIVIGRYNDLVKDGYIDEAPIPEGDRKFPMESKIAAIQTVEQKQEDLKTVIGNIHRFEDKESFVDAYADLSLTEDVLINMWDSVQEAESDVSYKLEEVGMVHPARSLEENVRALKTGEMRAEHFDINEMGEEIKMEYEMGDFNKRFEGLDLIVEDDLMGNVYVGQTKADIQAMKEAETPYDFGKLYGYSEADIYEFYKRRRGGREDIAKEEYEADKKAKEKQYKLEKKRLEGPYDPSKIKVTDREIHDTIEYAESLGVHIEVRVVNQDAIIDASDPRFHQALMNLFDGDERKVADAKAKGKKYRIKGLHTSRVGGDGIRRSRIELYRGHDSETLGHEVVHAIDEAGGFVGWTGSAEERADLLGKVIAEGKANQVIELTPTGSKVRRVSDIIGVQDKPIRLLTYDKTISVGAGAEIIVPDLKTTDIDINKPVQTGKVPSKVFKFREVGEKTKEGRSVTSINAEKMASKMRKGAVRLVLADNGQYYFVATGKGTKEIPAYRLYDSLKEGNIKVKAYILDMPAVYTCKNCSSCATSCYAVGAQTQYAAAKLGRFANLYMFLNHRDLFRDMINKQMANNDFSLVRLHSSGDVFSQRYIDFLDDIIKSNPDKMFYVYTKAEGLDMTQIDSRPNFNHVYSLLPDGSLNYGDLAYVTKKSKELGIPICPASKATSKLQDRKRKAAGDKEAIKAITAEFKDPAKTIHCANPDYTGKGFKCNKCTTNHHMLFLQHGAAMTTAGEAMMNDVRDTNFIENIQYQLEEVPRTETKFDAMQRRIDEIKRLKPEFKDQIVEMNELLRSSRAAVAAYKKGIKPGISTISKAQYDRLDKSYQNSKGAMTLIQATKGAGYGKDVAAFVEYLNQMKQAIGAIEADLAETKELKKLETEAQIIQSEMKNLSQRMSDYQQGLRTGVVQTREDIKRYQDELRAIIKDSKLDPKDVAKFIPLIRSAMTQRAMEDAIEKIQKRIVDYQRTARKGKLNTQIQKELKRTKPTKVGQKAVGRYDYETNKLVQEYKRISKLKQIDAAVELLAYPETDVSLSDLMKKRMLNLKANGMKSSVELFEAVLADIQHIKSSGAQAKTEADFDRLVSRAQDLNSALDGIRKSKDDKDSIKTKIVNLYRKGFANLPSQIMSMFGIDVANSMSPELAENDRNGAIYFKTSEIADEVGKIFGHKSKFMIYEALADMAKEEFSLTVAGRKTIKYTKLDLIDIYNSLKNDTVRERYYNAFGQEQIDAATQYLIPQDKAFGDYIQSVVQEYREVLNKRNIEITGLDLGEVDNYWPATSERETDFYDDIMIQGEISSAQKKRSASKKIIPIPTNAWLKMMKHISQGEHIRHVSREYERMKRLFNDPLIREEIETRFGKDVFKVFNEQLDNLSLNRITANVDLVTKMFGNMVNNWVTAKIALNPNVFVKQLISMGNYMELMPVSTWTGGFFKGMLSPRETFNYMWKNAPFLESRFHKGYSEAIEEAIRGAEQIGGAKAEWTNLLTGLVRGGDITAIIYGGFPYVQHLMSKEGGGLSQKQAFKQFELATLSAQQSGLRSSVSQPQNLKTAWSTPFLAFKNTPHQYFRKIVNANILYRRGEMTLEQYLKTMMIYAFIQPALYAAAGKGMAEMWQLLGNLFTGDEDDNEELTKELMLDILLQIAITPVNAIPLIEDAATWGLRYATKQPTYDAISLPVFQDINTAFSKLDKKKVTVADWIEISGTFVELGTGAPIHSWLRIYKRMFEEEKKRRRRR